jgi:hypothetical protein
LLLLRHLKKNDTIANRKERGLKEGTYLKIIAHLTENFLNYYISILLC